MRKVKPKPITVDELARELCELEYGKKMWLSAGLAAVREYRRYARRVLALSRAGRLPGPPRTRTRRKAKE